MSATRTTRSITAGTAVASAPREALGVERRAREALAGMEDEAMVEVRISTKAGTKALVPVGLLRRYLEAQEVDGRELLVFDSDEEVSSEVAASMLGVSRPHLNELLDVESIPYRRVGNQRRIRVVDIRAFRERREQAEAGLRIMAEITNESAEGREFESLLARRADPARAAPQSIEPGSAIQTLSIPSTPQRPSKWRS